MFNPVRRVESPEQILARLPLPKHLTSIKLARDEQVADIIRGVDSRKLMIIGPCSADNPDAVCDYVSKLAKVQERVKEKILIIPRIYTNKPRTKGEGYKGIFHQPDPNKDTDIEAGIIALRNMHIRAISESGLSAADEMLYPENYAYCADLLTYVTIGARSSENQQHRLVGSGIEVPLGVKNPMNGSFPVLLNSIYSTQIVNEFKYHDYQVRTSGNPLSHAVLRGLVDSSGATFTNYHFEDIVRFSDMYEKSALSNPAIIIDTNHSNSGKDPFQQPRILHEVLTNCKYPDFGRYIRGFLIESYLEDGAQGIDGKVYGKSITDGCIGWEKTERLIYDAAEMI